MAFLDTLLAASRRNTSLLCIGLDPEPARLPTRLRGTPDAVYQFCAALIEATADLACIFKPNSAFFEALGPEGMDVLRRVIAAVPAGIPVLLDAKRGDIGSTAQAYAHAAFEVLGADAITLSPFLGGDALQPFLDYRDKGCFILCKTSNPGSRDVQDIKLADDRPLYLEIARLAQAAWNANNNVGLVVGATHPAELRAVRAACPALPLLVPGIGAQGGDLVAAVAAAVDHSGECALINASRSIMYASHSDDFAEAARHEATRLRDAINAAREESGQRIGNG